MHESPHAFELRQTLQHTRPTGADASSTSGRACVVASPSSDDGIASSSSLSPSASPVAPDNARSGSPASTTAPEFEPPSAALDSTERSMASAAGLSIGPTVSSGLTSSPPRPAHETMKNTIQTGRRTQRAYPSARHPCETGGHPIAWSICHDTMTRLHAPPRQSRRPHPRSAAPCDGEENNPSGSMHMLT